MNRRIIKTTAPAYKGPKLAMRVVLGAGLVFAACGCGFDLNEFLHQAGDSGGRVLVDVLLTDLANAAAEAREQADAPEAPDPIDDDTDDTGDSGDVPPPGDLELDAEAGESVYTSNNCGGCHCADASGGCALSAPSLIGLAVEILDDSLLGDAPHVGGKFDLSTQDLADLEAYLAGL